MKKTKKISYFQMLKRKGYKLGTKAKLKGYAAGAKAKRKVAKMIISQMGKGTFKGSKRQRGKKSKNQRGGFGGGLAAGLLIPQILNTTGQILKISV